MSTTKRVAARAAGALLATGISTSAYAHHGYAQYDRCRKVSIEGVVESVAWENPHVVIMLETAEAGTYRVEWDSLLQLARTGILKPVLSPGEHLVVTGSTNRDPSTKIMTLLTGIRRAADGWSWAPPPGARDPSRCRAGGTPTRQSQSVGRVSKGSGR